VGPYGAALADGSEYRGDYGLDARGLYEFHRDRWCLLADTPADLLACETIPSAVEARALATLLVETPGRYAWFSFSCRDENHLHDGTPLADAVAPLVALEQVAAVGVNCTAPRFIPALIAEIRRMTGKPILTYPNSGESYDARHKSWIGVSGAAEFASDSEVWQAAGARLIGGCCRTGPEHIRLIRRRLTGSVQAE
jgi:homocysteine S-methyltransferase